MSWVSDTDLSGNLASAAGPEAGSVTSLSLSFFFMEVF